MTSRQGRPVLVVGASGAIGSAVARILGQAGHPLGLHYCGNRGAVDALMAELAGITPTYPLQSNLASVPDCEDLAHRFGDKVGKPINLALCGGRVPWKAWQDTDAADWTGAYFEHCVAPFAIARAASAAMTDGSRIAYLSSIAAKYGGSPRTIHYAAAKSGLEVAMRGLARELAPRRILVNGIRAGFVDTPQQGLGRSADERAARIARIPLGRAGTPEEVASAFAYLNSDGAAFMTGETIAIAGGD